MGARSKKTKRLSEWADEWWTAEEELSRAISRNRLLFALHRPTELQKTLFYREEVIQTALSGNR